MKTTRHWILPALLAASLLLKLGMLVAYLDHSERFWSTDTGTYWGPARALETAGRFSESAEEIERPETIRTPGYPLFLAACFALAGEGVLAPLVAQILLSLITLYGVHRMAAARRSTATGWAAAVLLAVDVNSFALALKLLTETLFTFLLVAAWWLALRLSRSALSHSTEPCARSALLWAASLGGCLGAAVLVRPVAYYLFLPAIVWVGWVIHRRRVSRKVIAGTILAFAIPWLVLVGGWQLRNQVLTGVPRLSGVEGINLLFYRGAAIVAMRDGVDLEEARRSLGEGRYQEVHPETAHLTPEELNEVWVREGKEIILDYPVLFLRSQIRGVGAILFGLGHHTLVRIAGVRLSSRGPIGDLFHLRPRDYVGRWLVERPGLFWAFVAEEIYLLLVYSGVVAWWIAAWRERTVSPVDVWAWLVIFYLLAISAGPEANARFRVPLMPFLAVYAALGFDRLRSWTRRRETKKTRPGRIPS